MKLYYDEILNPRKACAVAKYLNSPVEFVRIRLGNFENRKPEFLAVNPNGKLPTLTDGDVKMWEASAVMAYLARAAKSDLWPNDDRQVEVLRWLSFDANHFGRHAGMLFFEHIVKRMFGIGSPDTATVEESTSFFRKYAAVLDEHLQGRRYLLGDQLTIADFSMAATLPYAQEARIPFGEFSSVARWHDRLNELDAWREPFPKVAAAA
jgi:glutathione S-transferase